MSQPAHRLLFQSVQVGRGSVLYLAAGLLGTFAQVAGRADRLAVARVQPQRIVETTKALEVMHLGGGRHTTPLAARLAMRVRRQMRQPQPPPVSVVAAGGRAPAIRAAEARAGRGACAKPPWSCAEPWRE